MILEMHSAWCQMTWVLDKFSMAVLYLSLFLLFLHLVTIGAISLILLLNVSAVALMLLLPLLLL